MAHWPSHLRHSALASESDPGEDYASKRQCCGMPLWLFIMLLVLLLLVVAAAVVIPVVLVVLPRHDNSDSKALASCQKSLSCENGGTNIVGASGGCSCLCTNGFTGAQCTIELATGCTSMDTDSNSNVTVGKAIPRLLREAQSNFTLALNSTTILAMFSSSNLSCASENALVTFNGLSSRSVETELDFARAMSKEWVIPTSTLKRRQGGSVETHAATTSNGIVFDSTPTSTSSASSTSSAASTAVSSSPADVTMLDFARAVVLFVMQDSGQLNSAVTAQESLQDYFTSGTTNIGQVIDNTNITLAAGYTANLQKYTVTNAG